MLNYQFQGCTTSVRSPGEGDEWKERKCKSSQGGREHMDKVKKCPGEGKEAACLKHGACVGDVCKFCYRWECQEGKGSGVLQDDAVKKEHKKGKKHRGHRHHRRHHQQQQDQEESIPPGGQEGGDERRRKEDIISQLRRAWTELNILDES